MTGIEVIGAMLLPTSFLAFAVIFTPGRKVRSQILWTAFAVLISLPIGVMAASLPTFYMTYDPLYEHAPMFPIGVIPLAIGWLVAAFVWLIGSGLALVGLIELRATNSN